MRSDAIRIDKATVAAITADRLTKARRHQANQQFRVLSTDEKISNNDTWLTKYVIRKLGQDWSPEQIAGRLKLDHNRSISPTTIYSWIFGFSRFRYLSCHLHHIRGGNRRSRLALANRKRREEWKNTIRSIGVRPANVDKRATIGHFEGDSRDNKANGGKGVKVYFCHPYHSWERGSNENTNGLLRFYFPKKMDFGELTQSQLDWAVDRINNRPRKRLGYRTPKRAHEA
ncbi:IS30 family transposase [Candidatus Saccharibacteria bacterium]|nr:IS30 family transposase [Candidatus Saccharibacteria bacterium]